jgi:Protein of unknown function (DUF742)
VPPSGKWRPRDSGPVVRPYAVTGGRTAPADGEVLDLIAVVVATGRAVPPDDHPPLTPEHRRILGLCQQQVTVADLGAETTLPVGVVRVLLADLIAQGVVTVVRQRPSARRPQNDVLQEILNGLRAL